MEKTKVKILEIGKSREYKPGKFIYSFKGRDGNNDVYFQTFSKTIADSLKPELEVEIEYEKSTRAVGENTYTDRIVNQMWIDGKPVREDKKQFTSRGKSPEEILSIEQQVAVKLINEKILIDKADSEEIQAVKNYEKDKLKEYWPQKTTKPTPAQPQGQPAIPKEESKPSLPSFKTPGEFVAYCQKEFEISATELFNELNVHKATEIKDYQTAYEQIKAVRA